MQISYKIKASICSIFILLISAASYFYYNSNGDIDAVLGKYNTTDENLVEIINSPVMQRLKKIDQSGPARYFGKKLPAFSRYEHSIGVLALLKKVNAPIKEQIAGLLHDSSHTVFSHVADFIFAKKINDHTDVSYQDSIHLKYLKEKSNINQIIKKMNIKIEDLNPDNPEFKALEQHLPDMCADRIQYNIHTGEILGLISKKEASKIIKNIKFEDGKWYFSDKNLAIKFSNLSLYFTQNFWGAKWGVSMNIHLANSLKRALELKIIEEKDLFSTDDIIIEKLLKSNDNIIKLNLQQCQNPFEKIQNKKYKKEFFAPKFRGIDPLIKLKDGTFKRLTDLDHIFKNYYESVKSWCKNGFDIYILSK